MTIKHILAAALFGVAAFAMSPLPTAAETLTVATGTRQAPLKVPLNRAVVIESDAAFAELSVANPLIADIATLSERTIYVLGKAPGRTTLTLLGLDGRLITNVDVHVTPDVAELKERLSELLPGEAISVRTANDSIILSGTVSSVQRLNRALEVAGRYAPESVLNLMVVGGTQQVQMKVRFAEMSRSASKALGVGTTVTGTALGSTSFSSNTSGITGTPTGNLGFSIGGDALGFDVVVNALEEKGVLRTLAEPNLTALSGKPATFLAGGQIPIPVVDAEGNVGVDFRSVGVNLSLTPTVIDGDIINLALGAEVSAIDQGSAATNINGAAVSSITQRSVNTTVEMRDGQSFAIAGILQDDFSDAVNQVPILGDLPILGTLFRSSSYQRSQSELVIIVSAHLVSPVRDNNLALPTDRIRPPTDNELFLFGEVAVPVGNDTRGSTRSDTSIGDSLSGSYGYVLE